MSKADRADPQPPKRIGGATVPKRLRPSAGRLLALVSDPVVTDTIAAALIAGGGALAQRKGRNEIAKAAGLGAAAAAVKASKGANRLAVALLIALAEVAVAAAVKRANKPKRG